MSAEPIRSFRSSIAPARAVVDCAHCPTATACIVGGCSREDLNRWNDAMFSHIPLTMPGTTLFSVGDSADAVFIVRAGCIKTFTTDSEGNERVRGFHFPGSIVGLDTLGNTRWAYFDDQDIADHNIFGLRCHLRWSEYQRLAICNGNSAHFANVLM